MASHDSTRGGGGNGARSRGDSSDSPGRSSRRAGARGRRSSTAIERLERELQADARRRERLVAALREEIRGGRFEVDSRSIATAILERRMNIWPSGGRRRDD
jgi:anti-sigma28 factor (negative regulator of flagellin synthesis)